jgi:signal transduction histidine kinase/DNA-binding response OmpR family regulator
MYVLGDTIVFKTLNSPKYLVTTEPEGIIQFSDIDLSDRQNNITYLPGERAVLKVQDRDTIIDNESEIYQSILEFGDKEISTHLIDRSGCIWVGSRMRGLIRKCPGSNEWQEVPLELDGKTFFLSILQDIHGNIWVGTQNEGLHLIYQSSFQILNLNAGFSSNNIWSISEDRNGHVYVVSNCNGIDILYPDGTIKNDFLEDCLWGVLEDNQGNLWVMDRGITRISPNGVHVNYQKESGLHSRSPSAMMMDRNGEIWIGTRQAIHRFRNGRFVKYIIPGVDEIDRVFSIVDIGNETLLIVTNTGKLFKFQDLEFDQISFPSDQIMKLHLDDSDRLWIPTADQGLFLLQHPLTDDLANPENINATNAGLPKTIYQIQHDQIGHLWGIDDQNQLFQVEIQAILDLDRSAVHKVYSIAHGLPLIDLNVKTQPNSALLANGEVVLPNIYGAIKFDPANFVEDIGTFPTRITKFNDSLVFTSSFIGELPYGVNDVNFSLQGLSLKHKMPKEFRYRVNDASWIYTSSGRDNIIYDLPKGNNVIQIQGRYVNGEWHGDAATIRVHVPPLIHQKSWFWILVILALSMLVMVIVRWRTGIIETQRKLLADKVLQQTKVIQKEKEQLSTSLQKQTELTRELNLSQAAKNRMYAQISHEFKSPLQSVKGLLVGNQKVFSTNDQNRAIENIEKLISISDEIMELSKAESGNLKVNKNWYNLQNIIRHQIRLIEPLARVKNIQIHFQKEQDELYLHLDLSLMQKAIGNLLSNAIKFSNQNEEIIVKSEKRDEKQMISIIDHGTGIPEEEISQLTEPYYQASNNREQGTGIGLSLVKEILLLHGSKLIIESNLGKGSTFRFYLSHPNEEQRKDLKTSLLTKTHIQQQVDRIVDRQRPIILAVDDSLDILYFLEHTLRTNYHVMKAQNGLMALDLLDKIKPGLIISDVNMPVMGGIAFLDKVRSIQEFQATPFIFLTGSASEETELLGLQSGVDVIIQKPVNEQILIAQVKQLLKRQEDIKSSLKTSFAHDLLPKNIHNNDLMLMQKLENLMLEKIEDHQLKSTDLAHDMGVGEKTLRNRVKGITGITLKEYLRNFRLEKAKLLIQEEYGTLGEIALATGHSSLSYFSKRYKAYFGITPSAEVGA